MQGISKYSLESGINLYYIPVDKFKTFNLSINVHRKLNKEDVTRNALIPNVLKRGCESFPTSQGLAKHLEDLYGTVFDSGINKKGEDQIIYFNFEAIDDKYIAGDEKVLEKVLELSREIIFNPVKENGVFKDEYFNQEKSKLKDLIQSLINNKMAYAVERCYQEMFKGQDFGIYELGDIDDLDGISNKELYEHYCSLINTSRIDIFFAGDIDQNELVGLVERTFNVNIDKSIVSYPTTEIFTSTGEVKRVEESLQVNQAKLSLGFKTDISFQKGNEDDYYSLIICNGIFGGGPYSKLFNNVREKMGLAYYVFSRVEKFKGIVMVSAGIETDNFQKAYDEILLQLGEVKNGKISDNEFQSAINSVLNSLRSLKDSALNMTDYYLGQLVSGTDIDIDEFIKKVKRVKIEDVVRVAQGIELDTVYFLKGS